MSTNLAETEAGINATASRVHTIAASMRVQLLTSGFEAETLTFLSKRPLHTVSMAGLIIENGLISPLNRGEFYACRNTLGKLEGVALIGHATLVEAHSDTALEAFALLAQDNTRAHLIRGEQEMIERFLEYYTTSGGSPRLICRELLLERRQSFMPHETVSSLRAATLDDLEPILIVNDSMIYEECGVNPLQSDPVGFRQRTARRIERGRMWVWIEQGRLLFKTDVISDTPEVIYLEGIYVNPEERGKGYGFHCLTQLGNQLLQRAKSICLLVNEYNQAAINFYHKAGYTQQGRYDTIYLQQQNP